ncbi:MAG: ATP cone domain-containing protein [bacterium]
MAIENKIVTIKKRTGAPVPFDAERIQKAILKATQDIGGFKQDIIPDTIYSAFKEKTDNEIAGLLTDDVIMCLNSHQSYQNPVSAPDVETIQNHVVHVLRSRGFVDTADVYETYRWGKARVREGELTENQFAGSGYPREKMDAHYRWNCDHNCETIQKLNAWVLSGRFKDLVDASIAEYERQLDEVARLFLDKKGARIFFVAGPSSSGKTTTTSKLAQRLAKEGLRFHELNLDDYFKGLSEYPRDAFGDWDFETPQSLRLDLINQHLVELLDGKSVYKPIYDFKLGRSVLNAEKIRIESDEILLLDSLHGLYPPMTASVPGHVKFKLFIEAFSMIKLGDGADGILTKGTDIRMLRRMLRDRTQRNHQPQMTLGHWHFVRKGELRDMIPYIKTVDYVMNGGLSFELPVLKTVMGNEFPDPKWFLNQGRLDAFIRGERVRRILDTLMPVKDLSSSVIPEDCHLREFIGGLKL